MMVDVSQGLPLGLDLLPTFVSQMDSGLECSPSKSPDGMETLWCCQYAEVMGCLPEGPGQV